MEEGDATMKVKIFRFSAVFLILGLMVGALASPSPVRAWTLTVTTTDTAIGPCDSTVCSLPTAITVANLHPGPDFIAFNIPGPGPHTIHIGDIWDNSSWVLTDNLTFIQADTQPGYSGTPLIVLDGTTTTYGPTPALQIISFGNVISGFSFINFSESGGCRSCGSAIFMWPEASGNVIENNYIGLNPAGTIHGNIYGVKIYGGSRSNIIMNNVISGNQTGISLYGDSNHIISNLIGTDPDGSIGLGNEIGIDVNGENNLIGYSDPFFGNVISGNSEVGISLSSNNNRVLGNRIGTNKEGSAAVPNSSGISVRGSVNWIGGPEDGSENLISGNAVGVDLGGDSNYVLRNKIGTDAGGGGSIPNEVGIYLQGTNNIVGGGVGTGNRIASNRSNGIEIDGAAHAIINDNIITANGGNGVYLGRIGTNRISLSHNSIYRNGGLGIKFQSPEVNGGILPPTITEATATSARGTACVNCIIELFISDPDPSGFGEGKTYIARTVSGSDGTFHADFPDIGSCIQLTATATLGESTSEFSQNADVGLCMHLPPLLAWIWILVAAGSGTALTLVIAFAARRPRHLPGPAATAGLGLLGAVLGAGIGIGLLAMPFVQVQWPQGQQGGQAQPAGPSCSQFINETLLQPEDGAVFNPGTDVLIELSPQPDPPGMQTRWFLDVTGPGNKTVSKMLTADSISLSELGFDPTQTGFYFWTLRGERSQTGSNIWTSLCTDTIQRMFQIAAPQPNRIIATVQGNPNANATATATASPTQTLSPSGPTATLRQNSNCRRGPGTEYDSVTNLPQGLTAPITGRNPDSSWWQVQVPGTQTRCWLAGENVETSGDTSGVPAVEPPPLGCWVHEPNGDVCTVPCPQGAQPGGACEP
jgi:hypothetical protein